MLIKPIEGSVRNDLRDPSLQGTFTSVFEIVYGGQYTDEAVLQHISDVVIP